MIFLFSNIFKPALRFTHLSLCLLGRSSFSTRLTAHLLLVPLLRMSADIPTIPPVCLHIQVQLYFYLRQIEGQFYVTKKYFIPIDKSKLSAPVKGKVTLLKSNQIYELTWILTMMSQRGTVQLRSRRRNTVKKLNLSYVTTHAFTLAQWLYRCSSVQAAYSPSSPTASKSDDEQRKFYTLFYSDRIKQDFHMQSQSLKPKCKEKKVETGALQKLCYIHVGNTEIC